MKVVLQKRILRSRKEFKLAASNVAYLQGLADAGIVDAELLIAAIAKHETVMISVNEVAEPVVEVKPAPE